MYSLADIVALCVGCGSLMDIPQRTQGSAGGHLIWKDADSSKLCHETDHLRVSKKGSVL